jgi:hypothetical protein
MGLRPATMYDENNLSDVTHLFSVWLSAIFTAAKNPRICKSTNILRSLRQLRMTVLSLVVGVEASLCTEDTARQSCNQSQISNLRFQTAQENLCRTQAFSL